MIHILDQTITDQMIITKIDHEIIHKIQTQVTIIDTEISTLTLDIDTEVVHQNIKHTLIKCKQ